MEKPLKTWKCYAWMPNRRLRSGRQKESGSVYIDAISRQSARAEFLRRFGHAGRHISVGLVADNEVLVLN